MLVQETAQATIAALDTPRYEVVPAAGVVEQVSVIPRNVTFTVTCSPTRGMEPTIQTVESLAGLGFDTVPHLAARRVTGPDHLAEIRDRLKYAGVRNVYVIGGDSPEPLGPYQSALSLLRALAELDHPFTEVGIAAYPEGHPIIESDNLWEILHVKQLYATYLVTQMCFDASAISRWIVEARNRGIELPAIVGIPGAASRAHLLRMATKIGVGESARFLGRHSGMISRLVRPGAFTPDDLIDGLSPAMSDPALDIQGIHVYTFNNVIHTEDWRQRRLANASRR